MTEYFRECRAIDEEPIQCIRVDYKPSTQIRIQNQHGQIYMGIVSAKILRDWLNEALPCEHKRRFTGAKRVDPFGKSDAMVSVTNECMDCGKTVTAVDGGGEHG